MLAGEFHLKIFQILLLLSLMMTMIDSKVCIKKITEETLVKKNGHMEKVFIDRMVRVCCEGYTIDKTSPSKCISICTAGFIYENGGCLPRCDECENGTCLAPNDCQCEEDYIPVKTGCAPRCENECKNGYCAEPDICGCNKGYIQSSDGSGGCVPICEKCENGFCEKPGECQCKPGYKWNVHNFKCHPECKKTCEHGYCSAPNQCACHKGYRHSSLHPHVCVPESSGYHDSTENVGMAKSSELPEIEGFFRYSGRRIHFFGYFDGSEDETTNII